MKKIWKLIIALCLIVALAFPSSATSISEEENKKQELEQNLKDADDILDELKDKKKDANAYISKMDEELAVIEGEMENLDEQIEEKNQQIKDAKKELKKANKEMKQQYADMKKRIQYLYENGETKVIEMFLSSNSIADFLNKAEYTNEIAEYDRKMLDELKAKSAEIENTKSMLSQDREALKELKSQQSQQKKTIETLMASKATEVDIFDKQIAQTEEEREALKEEIAAQQSLIDEMKVIEEKRKQEASQRAESGEEVTSYDGGVFTWPTPGYSTITSGYAYRVDPITGEPDAYHNGIDIGAPYGSTIVAAHDGVVAWAYYSQTAGNFIGIDHGDGLYTVYMHCSSLLVSQDQTVSAGEAIGLVGSTGRSTGPHLHFGVRQNGEYVNPMNYLG